MGLWWLGVVLLILAEEAEGADTLGVFGKNPGVDGIPEASRLPLWSEVDRAGLADRRTCLSYVHGVLTVRHRVHGLGGTPSQTTLLPKQAELKVSECSPVNNL